MSKLFSRRNQKILLTLAVALVGLFTSSTISQNQPAPPTQTANFPLYAGYPVTKVVDGDTIDVAIDGKVTRVRLIGLDTPEVVDPRKPVQCFGKEASAEMKKLVDGQSVRLETDPSQGSYDKYDRLLAYVYRPLESKQEGLLVNEYMISEGYGHEYTYNSPYKYQADFKAAEKSARESKKGLWAPGVCMDLYP